MSYATVYPSDSHTGQFGIASMDGDFRICISAATGVDSNEYVNSTTS